MIFFQIRSGVCPEDWRVKVETQEHSLYPNQFPSTLPIDEGREFTVSISATSDQECQIDTITFEMNVTLTLLTTDNVFDNVKYVSCEMRARIGNTWMYARSTDVYLIYGSDVKTTDALIVSSTSTTISFTTSKCVKFESYFTLSLISAMMNIILFVHCDL